MEIETLCSSLDFGAAISKQAHEIELVNFQFDTNYSNSLGRNKHQITIIIGSPKKVTILHSKVRVACGQYRYVNWDGIECRASAHLPRKEIPMVLEFNSSSMAFKIIQGTLETLFPSSLSFHEDVCMQLINNIHKGVERKETPFNSFESRRIPQRRQAWIQAVCWETSEWHIARGINLILMNDMQYTASTFVSIGGGVIHKH